MQDKYISVILFCIVFCILIAPVSAADYCSFINITQGLQGIQGIQGIPGLNNLTPNWTAGATGAPGLNNMTPGYTPIFGIDYFNGTPGYTPIKGIDYFDGVNNMTAGPMGSMNLTANMTAGSQGIPGIMNQTINLTPGETGAPGPNNDAWYIWVNATRAFTGSLSMGNNKITSLITGLTGDSAVNKTYVDALPIINSSYTTTTFVNAVNDSMRTNVSQNLAPIVSGIVPTVNLGGAGADATKYLRGDQSWQVPAGGSGGDTNYTVNVQALTSSPADNAVTYFGNNPVVPSTTAGQSKIYIRQRGYIIGAEIYTYSGTAGTAQPWNLTVVRNNNFRCFIQNQALATSERTFSNWSPLFSNNCPVSSGDYIQIMSRQPLWITNPLTTTYGGYLVLNVT